MVIIIGERASATAHVPAHHLSMYIHVVYQITHANLSKQLTWSLLYCSHC